MILHARCRRALARLPPERSWFIDDGDFTVLPLLAVMWAAVFNIDVLRETGRVLPVSE